MTCKRKIFMPVGVIGLVLFIVAQFLPIGFLYFVLCYWVCAFLGILGYHLVVGDE